MIDRIVSTTRWSWPHVILIHSSAIVPIERRIPGQAPIRVPIGLAEVVARPVAIGSGIGDARDAGRDVNRVEELLHIGARYEGASSGRDIPG